MHKLYILMREDIPSMNYGKAMAQAAHAQALLSRDIEILKSKEAIYDAASQFRVQYDVWKMDGQNAYGTTIVVSVTLDELKKELENACYHSRDMMFGSVIDPTYPMNVNREVGELLEKNGCDVIYKENNVATVLREEITCAYIFTDIELDHLELYK